MADDTLTIIEAAYRIDLDEPTWLGKIADAAVAFLDRGLGVVAYTLETRPPHAGKIGAMVSRPHNADLLAFARDKLAVMPPPVAEIVLRVPIGFAASSEVAGPAAIRSFLGNNPFGLVDTAGVQGLDVSGASVWITIPSKSVFVIQQPMRERWQRIAAHLTAAVRLRRALAPTSSALDQADAVLEADLTIANATPRAEPSLEILRAFAKNIDRARGRLRREAPDEALALWRGLCDGTWSLIDHFDSDGRRFLVAHFNEPEVRPDRALTAREQQVVAFAAMGHADKLIAYELGMSEATVQTHLATAMRKLGVPNRSELIRTALALAPM